MDPGILRTPHYGPLATIDSPESLTLGAGMMFPGESPSRHHRAKLRPENLNDDDDDSKPNDERDDDNDDATQRPRSDSAVHRHVMSFVGVPPHLTIGGMLLSLVRIQVSSTATTLLYFCNQAVTMMFVGRYIGTEGLAHYSIGASVFNIVGLSVGIGLCTALDTLASQAYGRNPRSPDVGILLQRSLLATWALCGLIIVGFFHLQPVLEFAFGPSLGAGAAVFLMASPGFLLLLVTNFCLQKTLQAQQLPQVPVIANVVSAVACPIFNYYLTPRGVPYAVLAATLAVGVAVVIMAAVSFVHPRCVIWIAPWPAAAAFSPRGFLEFLRVGLPGMMSVVAEWWAFELIISFSARYGENVVTAFTISMSVLTFMFAVPSGLSVAAGVLCGNHLGMGDARGARAFAHLALIVGLVIVCVVDSLLYLFGGRVFHLYTSDEKVLALMNGIIHLMMVFHFCDSSQTILQGIFRSVGRQSMSARIVVASLWFVGLPASWYLGGKQEPLSGIMLGLIFGFVFEIPMLCLDMLMQWNWAEMAEIASKAPPEEPSSPGELRPLGDSAAVAVSYGGTNADDVDVAK